MEFAVTLALAALLVAQQEPGSTAARLAPGQVPLANTPPTQVAAGGTPAGASAKKPSEAERMIRLRRTIERDREQLTLVKKQLDDPSSNYHKAEEEFKRIDRKREDSKKQAQKLRDDGKTKEAEAAAAELEHLAKRWRETRDQFEVLIQQRKALQDKLAALTEKTRQNQQALDKVTGAAPAVTPSATAPQTATPLTPPRTGPVPPAVPGAPPVVRPPAGAVPIVGDPAGRTPPLPPAPGSVVPATPAPAAAPPAAVAPPATPGLVAPGGAGVPAAPAPTTPAAPLRPEVVKARAAADTKEKEAAAARADAQSLTERLEMLRKNVALEQKLLETSRQYAEQSAQRKQELEVRLQQGVAANAPHAELRTLTKKVEAIRQQVQESREAVREHTDRLNDLQEELRGLQAEQIAALQDAEQKNQAADDAETHVAALQNPFTVDNMLRWLYLHGPKILLILLGMIGLHFTIRVFCYRIARLVARAISRGSEADRENRSRTLISVFRNGASLVIFGGGTLMFVDEIGIPIIPLVGGAAIFGLAIAFGAQNLIRDYFSGFMILLEDQYGIDDVIRVGSVSGLVEKITMRMTVLRDIEGIVHFIPHGSLTTVSNLTHGWSRALFDIPVAYKENVDRVMQELSVLAHALRRDPCFAPVILDDAEMLGVESLGDSAVVIRFYLKTRPLQQWTVKRELLRRIKARFDALGIEIPFPHHTVYYRYANDHALPESNAGANAA